MTFSEPVQSGPRSKIPFMTSRKALRAAASVIFALRHTRCKIVKIPRFEIVDEFEHISVPVEESCGSGCGGQFKALISLTHKFKQDTTEHFLGLNQNDHFVIVQPLAYRKSIFQVLRV